MRYQHALHAPLRARITRRQSTRLSLLGVMWLSLRTFNGDSVLDALSRWTATAANA